MLSGFDRVSIRIGPLDFNVYHAGQGDPLLLLHGYPQTAQAWRRIAPRLSERFHVVIPDLPGYVASRIDNLDTFDFSKRSMGNLMLKLVTEERGSRFAWDSTILTGSADWHCSEPYRPSTSSKARATNQLSEHTTGTSSRSHIRSLKR